MLSRRKFLAQGGLLAGALALGRRSRAATDSQLKRISLRANGFRFDGLSAGPAKGELVLFLHGFPEFADTWANLLVPVGAWGFHAVAVNQRGYSSGARPTTVDEYAVAKLSSDALGFADCLGAQRFHLVGHDWGGAVAWVTAAHSSERLKTLTSLSTPHLAAFAAALKSDKDQQHRSRYLKLFQAPDHAAEKLLLANHAKALRGVYQGKVSSAEVDSDVHRLERDGTLTAALDWYRAMDFTQSLAPVRVPTLYAWGTEDMAFGKTAALDTARFCKGPYQFAPLAGKSHWLMHECPGEILGLLRKQFAIT